MLTAVMLASAEVLCCLCLPKELWCLVVERLKIVDRDLLVIGAKIARPEHHVAVAFEPHLDLSRPSADAFCV